MTIVLESYWSPSSLAHAQMLVVCSLEQAHLFPPQEGASQIIKGKRSCVRAAVLSIDNSIFNCCARSRWGDVSVKSTLSIWEQWQRDFVWLCHRDSRKIRVRKRFSQQSSPSAVNRQTAGRLPLSFFPPISPYKLLQSFIQNKIFLVYCQVEGPLNLTSEAHLPIICSN